jgi:dethiobiotin synthetase
LLSIEALKSRGIPVRGVIFNDEENVDTESVILKMTGLKCLGRVPMLEELTSNSIAECAKGIEI